MLLYKQVAPPEQNAFLTLTNSWIQSCDILHCSCTLTVQPMLHSRMIEASMMHANPWIFARNGYDYEKLVLTRSCLL
jgi:hypothetical protein